MQVSSPLPWPTTRLHHWLSCKAGVPAPRYFYCLGTRLRKGVAWLYFFFFPFHPFIWLNPGKHRGWLTFWSSVMGSALQTASCNSQGHGDAAHHPLSPTLLFFSHPLTASKMNESGSPGPELGEPWGPPGEPHFPAPRRKELLPAA